MFTHRLDEMPSKKVVANWFLLSLNAGCINAGGFLATGRFVSHVTGFATLFGVELVNQRLESAFGLMAVPFFFLFGAFFAGMLIDRPIHRKRKPHFDYVMGLSALCLFLVAIGGELVEFGQFGQLLDLKHLYIFLSLLCLACGLQNAAITSSSGSSVRTTHLTGLTTDLGLGLARIFSFQKGDDLGKRAKVARANELRAGSILAFMVGSALGAWIFLKIGYRGFVFSGLIASYAAWHGRKAKIAAHKAGFL